jgi:DNA polymerase-3 subunit delta'
MFDEFDEEDDFLEVDDNSANAIGGLVVPRESFISFGYEEIESEFLNYILSGKMPHGLIFAGPEGIGKSTFAYRLMRFLLTYKDDDADEGGGLFGEPLPKVKPSNLDAARDTQAVKLISQNAHPDVMVIEREWDEKRGAFKGTISVEAIRRVPTFLQKTAALGGWRIVLVEDADTMTVPAQNALLKILEEPPAKAIIILIAHRPGALLTTIRSRSRYVPFEIPSKDVFSKIVRMQETDLSNANLDTLHSISKGSIGQGLRLARLDVISIIMRIMDIIRDWPKWDWVAVHAMADEYSRPDQIDSFETFTDVFKWVVDSLVTAKARKSVLPGPLNNSTMRIVLSETSLYDLMALRDRVYEHFKTAQLGSLDKKHAVMGTFMALTATS